jgi:two-component system, sensor histidine kinase YesM
VRFPVKGNDEIAVLGNAFNNMLDQINLLFARVKQEQEDKRIIELQALFAQIRPHFLINTLNSIKCNLILSNDPIHSSQIDSLMRLLRAYMNVDELTTLNQECKLLVDYTDIMKMRNDMNLKLMINLPQELEIFIVPRLILQPLVENAIVHAFHDELPYNPIICINVQSVNGKVIIEVLDNGVGMAPEKIKNVLTSLEADEKQDEHNEHIGLKNVYQRLKLTYGRDMSLDIYANEELGVSIALNIPMEEKFIN